MPEVMRQLRQDHRNTARLMHLLEEQVQSLEASTRTDFELMQDVMQYMTHYPDRHHHPTEDLVFQRLVARDESARAAVDELLQEHQDLAEKGSHLLHTLRQVVDGALVARESIDERARDYIETQRRHMSKEEEHVFPRAEGILRDEDWAEVERRKEAMRDPLFGPVVDEDYRTLYELIVGSSE